ncbi:MAG: MBL fold metallo-hydrolase [Bacteroidota bacterium]
MSKTVTNNVKITRVSNACILMEMGGHAILTDPFFINTKMIGIKEDVAIDPEDLPPLTAIIGCHDIVDHWQMKGLADYPHDKDLVKVYVAMKGQVKSARKYGFNNAEVLQWGETRTIGGLTIEAVKAQKMMVWRVNNYVLRYGEVSVFFGSEARDLEPLEAYRKKNGPVDIAVFPTNGVHLFGFYQLVMKGEEAVEGTKILGAKKLFVIHDAHPEIPGFIHIKSSRQDAIRKAFSREVPKVDVVHVNPGILWDYDVVNKIGVV